MIIGQVATEDLSKHLSIQNLYFPIVIVGLMKSKNGQIMYGLRALVIPGMLG